MGLHASPTRWYEKTLPPSRSGAKRRRTSLTVAVTITVAATVVVTAASTSAWIALNGGDVTSMTTSAALRPAARITAGPPANAADSTTIAASAPFGVATPFGRPASAGSAPALLTPPAAAPPSPSAPAPSTGTGTDDARRAAAAGEDHPAGGGATAKAASKAGDAPKAAAASRKAAKKRREVKIIASGRCEASYYDEGQMTASGERFNPNAMTAAHKTLPMGSRVRVTNPGTGKTVTVRINDRGPYIGGRCLDLSRAAFDAIGNLGTGAMSVRYAVLAR
ncbi:septal ring lytic transglycosylase RlpA family protein [Sphaerisporangium dianthi]|uniref:Probable endolytic peptidoglycan transglycosylase RlpA n=1 Tax=Sphaerisporangium dianthi TaxID=1436120 RepID=A0ABV9CFW6_9ACTN